MSRPNGGIVQEMNNNDIFSSGFTVLSTLYFKVITMLRRLQIKSIRIVFNESLTLKKLLIQLMDGWRISKVIASCLWGREFKV